MTSLETAGLHNIPTVKRYLHLAKRFKNKKKKKKRINNFRFSFIIGNVSEEVQKPAKWAWRD